MGFFHFSSSSFLYFLKYQRNVRKFCLLKYKEFFRVSVSWNIRKAFLWENIRNFQIKKIRKFHLSKYKEFSRGRFFLFFELGLKNSISQNIRKDKKFFNIRARKFHFSKYKDFLGGRGGGGDFFLFFELGPKSAHNILLIRKHAMQCFWHITYHTCLFNLMCVGSCECDRTPFSSRPDIV